MKKLHVKRSSDLVDKVPVGESAKRCKVDDEPEGSSAKSVSLADFPEKSVIRVLEATSKLKVPKFIAGNISGATSMRMTDPVTGLIGEIHSPDEENYIKLSCELETNYPDYSFDSKSITAALIVAAVKLIEQPDDMTGTLCVKPDHLSVTAPVTGQVHDRLVVGNYTLTIVDMDTLKPGQWLTDNVSALT